MAEEGSMKTNINVFAQCCLNKEGIKKFKSQNYIQQDCAGKDDIKYMKDKGIYEYIHYITLFKLLDNTYCI